MTQEEGISAVLIDVCLCVNTVNTTTEHGGRFTRVGEETAPVEGETELRSLSLETEGIQPTE